jgi:hypothetical protein
LPAKEGKMQKWEYCILKQQGKQEFWLYSETGSKEKLTGKEHSLARVLIHLGLEGWEAVNYVIKDSSASDYASWPERQIREIMFKRLLSD